MLNKINRKLRKKSFRRVVLGTGILATMGFTALLSNKDTSEAISKSVQPELGNYTNMAVMDAVETAQEDYKSVLIDNIINEYNKLGNNLEKNDLGCVLQTKENASYLFLDSNNKYVFDITMDTTGLDRVENDYSILVFVDKEKGNKPIAATGKIGIFPIEVNAKSVDINGTKYIQDSNNYVNMHIDFDVALDYLQKREAMLK